mmetsp:Transcript_2444/g.2667  ORF Transcript_2444/g.2667 Transcript_2444/m.2667 type:complete len:123 (+) Transcript_2444:147-515(+)
MRHIVDEKIVLLTFFYFIIRTTKDEREIELIVYCREPARLSSERHATGRTVPLCDDSLIKRKPRKKVAMTQQKIQHHVYRFRWHRNGTDLTSCPRKPQRPQPPKKPQSSSRSVESVFFLIFI